MDEGKKENVEEKKEETSKPEVKEIKKEVHNKEVRTAKNEELALTDKIRENPWVVSTLVLGVVVIILLLGDFSGGMTGGTVGVASQEDVEQKILSFINSQVEGEVELVETNFKAGLYEIVVLVEGREIPVYVTSDGENLVQGVTFTPIDVLVQQTATQQQAEVPTEIPKTDKPVVDLFVMSICPYGTQAEKGILPVIMKLGDKIDFNLRFVSYAMHGKTEIDENTVQYCVQKNQPEKFYDYLECYLEEQGADSWSACRKKVGIDEKKLTDCIASADSQFKITELYNDKSTWNGGTYPPYNIDIALNTQYGVQGSPTLIINGAKSNAGRDPASYLAGICAAFNNAPAECSVVLPSDTPAPGFGWDALAASDTVAQCG